MFPELNVIIKLSIEWSYLQLDIVIHLESKLLYISQSETTCLVHKNYLGVFSKEGYHSLLPGVLNRELCVGFGDLHF